MSVLKIKDEFGNFTSLPVLKGDKGDQGDPGPAGTNGTNGTNGTDGVDGTNGTNGTDGVDGEDGLSAYQIWLNLGNTGTEQDFIDSLEGPQGPQGETGAPPVDSVVTVTNGLLDLSLGSTFMVTVSSPTTLTVVNAQPNVNHEFSVELVVSGAGKTTFTNNVIWSDGVLLGDSVGTYLLTFETLDGGTTVYNTSKQYFDTRWEVAVDSDFSGSTDGAFRYIGTKQYVIIPHVIKGVNVTSYNYLFNNNTAGVKGVISTNKNITNVDNMFDTMTTTSLELPIFYLGSCVRMNGFLRYLVADSVDLSKLDTSNITLMTSFFSRATIGEIIFGDFNTENVISMGTMFYNTTTKNLDLTSFNTSNVTSMYEMFRGSTITTLDVSSFNTKKVTEMSNMFYSNTTDILDLSSFDMSGVTNKANMFNSSKASVGLSKTTPDAIILNATTNKPTYLTFKMKLPEPYEWATEDAFVGTPNGVYPNQLRYVGPKKYVAIPWYVGGVLLTSYAQMFINNSVVQGVFSDNPNITTMEGMLQSTQQLEIDTQYLLTKNVTTTTQMFYGSQVKNIDTRSFEVRARTTLQNAFGSNQAISLVSDYEKMDTRNITNMSYMFASSKISQIDLSSFDTNKATSYTNVFQSATTTDVWCKTYADMTKLQGSGSVPATLTMRIRTPAPYVMAVDADFSGTTNGTFVYTGTKPYVVIPVTIKGVTVTSYAGMFQNNTVVRGVMNHSAVITDMSNMFKGCTVKNLDLSRLDTRAVTNMTSMFENTTVLETLHIPRFNTQALLTTTNMFKATNVPILDLYTFDTATITTTTDMFANALSTTGYAYTQADANKFNASSNKPSALTFIVRSY